MFDPEMIDPELLKDEDTFLGFVTRQLGRWKPFTAYRVIAVEIAPCGHVDCPPIDFVEYSRGWTPRGVMRRARRRFLRERRAVELVREFNRQKAISEALGG